MIDLDLVAEACARAQDKLGEGGSASVLSTLLNESNRYGRKLRIDGGTAIISYQEQDRGTHNVEFTTSDQEELIRYLIDRLVRSLVVRDMMRDPQSKTISIDEYNLRFDRILREYQSRVSS